MAKFFKCSICGGIFHINMEGSPGICKFCNDKNQNDALPERHLTGDEDDHR